MARTPAPKPTTALAKAPDAPADSLPVATAAPTLDARALATDVALRSSGRLARNALQTMILMPVVGSAARRMTSERGIGSMLLGTVLARVATRSVPGALLVGGGIAAKALLDRRKARRSIAVGTLPPPMPRKSKK